MSENLCLIWDGSFRVRAAKGGRGPGFYYEFAPLYRFHKNSVDIKSSLLLISFPLPPLYPLYGSTHLENVQSTRSKTKKNVTFKRNELEGLSRENQSLYPPTWLSDQFSYWSTQIGEGFFRLKHPSPDSMRPKTRGGRQGDFFFKKFLQLV